MGDLSLRRPPPQMCCVPQDEEANEAGRSSDPRENSQIFHNEEAGRLGPDVTGLFLSFTPTSSGLCVETEQTTSTRAAALPGFLIHPLSPALLNNWERLEIRLE